jgi:hypothetical protein
MVVLKVNSASRSHLRGGAQAVRVGEEVLDGERLRGPKPAIVCR